MYVLDETYKYAVQIASLLLLFINLPRYLYWSHSYESGKELLHQQPILLWLTKPLKIPELSLNSPKCVNYKELHVVTETRWSGSNFRWVLEISYIWRACKFFDFWLRLIWARIGLLTLNSVCWEGFLVCFVSCFFSSEELLSESQPCLQLIWSV